MRPVRKPACTRGRPTIKLPIERSERPAMTDPDPVDGLRPGMRAVVRRRIEHGLTDALGEVVAIDAETVSVRTRGGVELIDRAAVVAAKEVPPKPARRGAPHLAISMHDLEQIMVEGWPPLERAELGSWLLRAGAGFTGRANSVLPLGDPGISLPEAIDQCERWYVDRGLRRLFALFGPTGFAIDDDPLGRELRARGYEPFSSTAVLTAATAALPPEIPHRSGATVRLESEPSSQWWQAWAARDEHSTKADPAAVRAVMIGSPDQLFASVEVDGLVVGIARLALARGWAGVFALRVEPAYRRTGIAVQLMSALAEASRLAGIRSMYLQVLNASAPARGLYERLGFSTHHQYRYLGR
jgi:ribosomal protein S18 acetylase RimI-like enzyme